MKVKVVYFAYLVPNKWEDIVIEQLNSLKNTHLYDEAINIYMSVISDDEELNKLKILLNNEYSKVQIFNVYKDNVYEFPGIDVLYKIAEDDPEILLLYLHSKGMTSNQHTTRKTLFKYTIDNYQEYINEFDNNKSLDVAGAIPHVTGLIFFNFFWVRSSYVRNYCSKPEYWIIDLYGNIGLVLNTVRKDIITFSPIIKYKKVNSYEEVWDIHDKMVRGETGIEADASVPI